MNAELEQRWRGLRAPFSGETLAPAEMLRLGDLASALRIVFEVLRRRGGDRALYVLFDRHEADGAATESRSCGWDWLAKLVSDPASLYRERSGETLVSLGFYHEEPSFYLRTYVMGEDEDQDYPGRWGDFDLSGDAILVREVERALKDLRLPLEREPAARYFQRRSAE